MKLLYHFCSIFLCLGLVVADVPQSQASGSVVTSTASYQPPVLSGIKIFPKEPFRFDFLMTEGDSALSFPRRRESTGHNDWYDQNMDPRLHGDDNMEAMKLIRYFLASLTVPEGDLWVNLSPNEPDRIIPDALGQTQMGHDLLAQDYILKKLTASLMHPDGETGKKFWEKVYSAVIASKAKQSTNGLLQTETSEMQNNVHGLPRRLTTPRDGVFDQLPELFNKIWIVPDQVEVYQNNDVAYITNAKLKVMTESDYVAEVKSQDLSFPRRRETTGHNDWYDQNMDPRLHGDDNSQQPATNNSAKESMKNILLPVIEHEVNHGESFAPLRQIFHSMILAKWYESHFKDSIIGQHYVDRNKISGLSGYRHSELDSESSKVVDGSVNDVETSNAFDLAGGSLDPGSGSGMAGSSTTINQIYQSYLDLFKTGVTDVIREEYDPIEQKLVTRKYFSGGFEGSVDFGKIEKMDLDSVDYLDLASLNIVSAKFKNKDESQVQDKAGLAFSTFVKYGVVLAVAIVIGLFLFSSLAVVEDGIDSFDLKYEVTVLDPGLVSSRDDVLKLAQMITDLPSPTKKQQRFQFYRVGEENFYFLMFSHHIDQSNMFDRIALFVEIDGYVGQVLNDEQIILAKKELRKQYIFGGHDYGLNSLADFFNKARVEGVKLNSSEIMLRNFLLKNGLIQNVDTQFIPVENSVVLSFVHSPEQWVVEHEIDHGFWFVSKEYRRMVREVWQEVSPEFQAIVLEFLSLHNYDTTNPDLVEREFSAYFMNPQSVLNLHRGEYQSYIHGNLSVNQKRVLESMMKKTAISTKQHFFTFQYDTIMKNHKPFMDSTNRMLQPGFRLKTVFPRSEYIDALEEVGNKLIENQALFLGSSSQNGDFVGMAEFKFKPLSLPENFHIYSQRPGGPAIYSTTINRTTIFIKSEEGVRVFIQEKGGEWQVEMTNRFNKFLKDNPGVSQFKVIFDSGTTIEYTDELMFDSERVPYLYFVVDEWKVENDQAALRKSDVNSENQKKSESNVGGIDLNNLNIESDGAMMDVDIDSRLHGNDIFDPAMLNTSTSFSDQIQIPFLMPKILSISKFENKAQLAEFLNLDQSSDEQTGERANDLIAIRESDAGFI